MPQFDFVSIGDIVTDAFIKLREAEVHEHMKTHTKEISMPWGTKIPYEGVVVIPAVGNCANAAVSASRLGLSTALITNQGDDEVGRMHLETLKKNMVATDFVATHKGMLSNYHYVLSFKGERTILVKHEHYPYKFPDITKPKWIYLTSLGEDTLDFHNQISDYLEKNPDVKLSFQPGTFQIRLGAQKLSRIYKRAEIFFANVEESQQILDEESRDIKTLARGLSNLGPRYVFITDGPDGAYGYDKELDKLLFIPPYPDPKPPVDRTGAGDAFASTVTSVLALGFDLERALQFGPINSMSVVQYFGAQEGLLSKDEIAKFLANAPENYKIRNI